MATSPTHPPLPARPQAADRSGRLAAAVTLVFVGLGLWLMGAGLRGLLGPDPGNGAVMQVAGGFVFAAMGGLGTWLSLRDDRQRLSRGALQRRHPGEPWKWRPDWERGRIGCASGTGAILLSLFAAIWNAFCVPMLWAVDGPEVVFVSVFVLVGAGLAVFSLVELWRWRRFGRCVFTSTSLPGTPGGRIRGSVQLGRALRPAGGFRATLSCYRFRTGRNGGEELLWQEEGRVRESAVSAGPRGSVVPVDFSIPGDVAPSSVPGCSSGIRWRLDVRANVPGVDLHASFEVPVFAGAAAASDRFASWPDASGPARVLEPEAPPAVDRERFTPDSPIRRIRRDDGGVELRLPPARNKGQAAFLLAVTFVWSFFAALAAAAAPPFFGVVFVGAWLFLLYASICMWLRRWRIVAAASGLRVRSSVLGLGLTRSIPAADVQRIEAKLTGEFGSQALYELRVQRRAGRPVHAGDGIRSKREAEWLCAALAQGLRGADGNA